VARKAGLQLSSVESPDDALSASPARSRVRFFYVVRPIGEQWEVTFSETEGGSVFVYATRHEALQVARGAAKLHWETRQEFSGVEVREGDRKRVVGKFGP
jgi:hypothetical protein